MGRKVSAIVLVVILVVSCFNFISFAEAETEFAITNVLTRSGANGEYQTNRYIAKNTGLDAPKVIWSDRTYYYKEIPEEFLNCAYIMTAKSDVSKEYFLNGCTDWLTFEINKSATIYLIDYYAKVSTSAKWIIDQNWDIELRDDVSWEEVNGTSSNVTTSYKIVSKHFDVPEGEILKIELGGYDTQPYNNYSIFIKPDDMAPFTEDILSEEDMTSDTWEEEIIANLGEAFVAAKGCAKTFAYGVKTYIPQINDDIVTAPIEKNGVYYLPTDFAVSTLGGSIKVVSESVSEITYNSKKYTVTYGNNNISSSDGNGLVLSVPAVIENNVGYIPSDAIEKIYSKILTVTDGGVMIFKENAEEISSELAGDIKNVFLTDMSSLGKRAAHTKPGDEIVIENGIYYDYCPIIVLNGEEGKNITVRSQTPGGVEFRGKTSITFSGKYIVVRDFYFNECRPSQQLLTFSGFSYGRMTGCYFYGCGSSDHAGYPYIDVKLKSQYNRFDHNTFEMNYSKGLQIMLGDDNALNRENTYNRIDHNYIKDLRKEEDLRGTSGNMEPLQIGITTGNGDLPLYTTVEYNLLEECIGDGNEIIGNKSGSNIYRYNTFLNCNAHWMFRTGLNCVLDRSYFINCDGGIYIMGSGHKVLNNYFYNCKEWAVKFIVGNGAIERNDYIQVKNTLVANNTFMNSNEFAMLFGHDFRGAKNDNYTYAPKNTTVINNLFVQERGQLIADYVSFGTKYINNLAVVSGSASPGVTDDGLKILKAETYSKISDNMGSVTAKTGGHDIKMELVDGIYVPTDESTLINAGEYSEDIYSADEYMQLKEDKTFDIGINNAREAFEEIGPMTSDDVGPVEKWWIPLMRKKPIDNTDIIPEETPKKYTPAGNSITVAVGESFNLSTLAGKATFENGRTYAVSTEEVKYEITEGKDIFKTDGKYITSSATGTGILKTSYRGYEFEIPLLSVQFHDNTTKITRTFDAEANLGTFKEIDGSWKVKDGVLICENPGKTQVTIVDFENYFKGDYSFSADVTVGDNGNTAVGRQFDAGVVFGYKNNPDAEFHSIYFGAKPFYAKGAYHWDGYYLPNIRAEIFGDIEPHTTYRVELRRIGNRATLFINGEYVCVYETKDSLDGYVGFCSRNNAVTFDNVEITPLEKQEELTVKELGISAAMSDVYAVTLTMDELSENIIYKVYRDGVWFNDVNTTTYEDTTLQEKDKYHYEVYAIDEWGRTVAKGICDFEYPDKLPDDMYYISGLRHRLAPDRSFIYDYTWLGFKKGLDNDKRVFEDHTTIYYKDLPEKFVGAGYIQVNTVWTKNPITAEPDLNDFMEFELNNRSATVYVVLHSQTDSFVPGWIYNDEWRLTHDVIYHTVDADPSSSVWKKHFDVKKGEAVTVTLGSFGQVPKRPYAVFILWDEE